MLRPSGVLLVLVLAVASCSGDDEGGSTSAPTSQSTTSTTSGSTTSTTTTSTTATGTKGTKGETTRPSTTSTPAPPQTTDPAAPATTAPSPGTATTAVTETMASFASPSGNILCALNSDSGVRCDIGDVEWTPPPKPQDCEFDWGSYLQLEEEAGFACVSDTPFNEQPEVVPYGSAVRRGIYTCDVARSGVTCRNTETGAGFLVSRGRYELFGE